MFMGITEAIRRAFRESGQTQRSVSRATGIEEAPLSRFFNGKRGATNVTIDKLYVHFFGEHKQPPLHQKSDAVA